MHDRTPQLILFALLASGVSAQEETEVALPTWHGEIARVVSVHCASCHAEGKVAPFSLSSYEDVARRARFIDHVLREELMPPWLPSGGVAFLGDRTMSDEDRALIGAWIESGLPRGTPPKKAQAKEPAEIERTSTVRARTASMRQPWVVPAEGGERWFKAERDKRTFVLPLENPESLRVQAIEYRTKAPIALAATALSVDTTGNARKVIDWDEEPGSYMMGDIGFVAAGSLGVVGPGGGRLDIPDGFHVSIPSSADIVSEIHFRPQGRAWKLEDEVLVEEVPAGVDSRELVALNLMVRKIELAAGESRDFTSRMTLPLAVDVVAITPRASRRCTSLSILARIPDREEPLLLLDIEDWNPHYRSTLFLVDPLHLPAGTIIEGAWHYDNSEANPRNPVVPPEDVSLGARCGSANVLLLCAPEDEDELSTLERFAHDEIRGRQRDA